MKYPYYFWPETPIPWADCAGSNAKRTLILSVSAETAGNLPLLKKILRAIDLDFDEDIHFLYTPDNFQTQLMADPHLGSYRRLILFGISPSQVGIPSRGTAECQVFHFEKCVCIAAPSLDDIEKKPEQKKVLWSALKMVFQNADE